MSRLLLCLSCLLAAAPARPAPPPVHDLHLTYTRLVLDGRTVGARIRLFHDDLQLALRAYTRDSTLVLDAEQRRDSLFGAYVRRHLGMRLDGDSLILRVTGSGEEQDPGGQRLLWYVLEGEAPRAPRRLTLLNGLLFEAFKDQQNIVQLLRLPGEERRTLYFTASDAREQQLTF